MHRCWLGWVGFAGDVEARGGKLMRSMSRHGSGKVSGLSCGNSGRLTGAIHEAYTTFATTRRRNRNTTSVKESTYSILIVEYIRLLRRENIALSRHLPGRLLPPLRRLPYISRESRSPSAESQHPSAATFVPPLLQPSISGPPPAPALARFRTAEKSNAGRKKKRNGGCFMVG
ncbi:hypothetical protein EDC01DRAFT_263506 [Geopyxis carbonaria]|nr:hypothetical protein EDC01DRAFT_263506 [Geopyxis carbonaria]